MGLIDKDSVKRYTREFVVYLSATLWTNAARFAVFLSVAKILGPDTWGRWQLLSLVVAYGSFSHLGIINGMGIELPRAIGSDDAHRPALVKGVAFVQALFSMFVFSVLIFLFLSSRISDHLELLGVILLMIFFQLYVFYQFSYRGHEWFSALSSLQSLYGVGLVVLAVACAALWGLRGFIAGQILAYGIGISLVGRRFPVDLHPAFDWSMTVYLIRIGFPIMLTGLSYSLLTTLDRWIITAFIDVRSLGFYSMAIITWQLLALPTAVISNQVYPRMAKIRDVKLDVQRIKKWISIQNIFSGVVALVLAGVAYTLFPMIIQRFLPRYVPGIAALKILALAPFIAGSLSGYGNAMLVMDKQNYCLLAQLGALVVNAVMSITLVTLGYGIEGVAVGTVISHWVCALLVMVMSRRFLQQLASEEAPIRS